jgi:hypothetical protein
MVIRWRRARRRKECVMKDLLLAAIGIDIVDACARRLPSCVLHLMSVPPERSRNGPFDSIHGNE